MVPVSDQVLRKIHREEYKTVNLKGLHEDGLSWKAKGLLWYLMSRPDGWHFRRRDIEGRSTDGRDSVRNGLRELKDMGYLQIRPRQARDGKFIGHEWLVTEDPDDLPLPNSDSPNDGKPEIRLTGHSEDPSFTRKGGLVESRTGRNAGRNFDLTVKGLRPPSRTPRNGKGTPMTPRETACYLGAENECYRFDLGDSPPQGLVSGENKLDVEDLVELPRNTLVGLTALMLKAKPEGDRFEQILAERDYRIFQFAARLLNEFTKDRDGDRWRGIRLTFWALAHSYRFSKLPMPAAEDKGSLHNFFARVGVFNERKKEKKVSWVEAARMEFYRERNAYDGRLSEEARESLREEMAKHGL